MHSPHAARYLALIYALTLVLPLLALAPTAEATHAGTRTADAFRGRPVAFNTSAISGSGLAANDNWRSGTTTFGDRADVSGTNTQSNSACSQATTTTSNFVQWVYFTKEVGQHPRVNHSAKDPRSLDNLYILADIPSSGSTTTCGYFYGIQASLATGSWVETETFLGKCGKIGGGNAANGNTQTSCTVPFTNGEFDGIKMIVASGYSTYTPVAFINEIQGSGIAMTPPVIAPTLTTATAVGCTAAIEWNQTADTTGYHLYRGATSGFTASPTNRIATLSGATSTGYTDASVVTETTYHYRVSATNSDGEGPAGASASVTPGLCDGAGRGSIGADSHVGPNLLNLDGVTTSYTFTPTWAWTSTSPMCEPSPDYRAAMACITDGNYTTGAEINSFGTFATGGASCESTGWVDWNWTTPRELQTVYLSVKALGNSGYTAGLNGCVKAQYLTTSNTYVTVGTWTNMSHGVRNDLWANLTTPAQAKGLRIYLGDARTATTVSMGFALHELDAYSTNSTYYPYTAALRDTIARYSVPIPSLANLGGAPFQGRPFTLGNGEWYVYMLEPTNISRGATNPWTFSAAGGGFSSTKIMSGPVAPSWEWPLDTLPARRCQVALYQLTISGGSKTITPETRYPVDGNTQLCRLTGTSFIPSAYQFGEYKVRADLTTRGMGTGEEMGRIYLKNAFPFFPALDSDVSTVTFIKDANFSIGPILFGTGTPGTRAILTLADYPYGWTGNGIFIALGQDATNDASVKSTNFEVLLNGRPMSVVYNGKSAQYEYAIFYVDDQARRRNLTEPDSSDVLEGNRRVHGVVPEAYEFEIKSGFSPSKPIRVMRSLGSEGHSVITCRDFCSANVRLDVFKLNRDNMNRIELTVRDQNNQPLQSARITDNVTGDFFFTNATGKILITDRYRDTLFTITKSGYYSKCLGYVYVTAEGQSVSTITQPCGSSEAYPQVRAQNLVYTTILYPITVAEHQTTEFNEVPVEVVTKPVQGIVFRGNLTRIVADQVSIQVQRNIGEDLKLTVFKYDPRTGTLHRVTDPLNWPINSNANPLLVVYPGGRATTNADEGGYHLMVQRGNTYVTGVNFKILADWSHLHTIATPGDIPQNAGDELAGTITREQQQTAANNHQAALERAAGSVDTGGALSQAVVLVPVILLLLFVGLLLRGVA